jgi:hypothetical protein
MDSAGSGGMLGAGAGRAAAARAVGRARTPERTT